MRCSRQAAIWRMLIVSATRTVTVSRFPPANEGVSRSPAHRRATVIVTTRIPTTTPIG